MCTRINAQIPQTTKPSAKSLLNETAQFIENCYSIQSNITYQANLLSQQINGKGTYAELRNKRIPYFRLELKIPLGDKMGVLAKVCDGRYLWTYRKVLDHEDLEQVDMDRVQEALEKKQGNTTGQPRDRFPTTPSAFAAIGEGGLANLVRQLNENFDFGPATESKLDRLPIQRIEGTWKRKNLLKFLPKQKTSIEQGNAPDLSKLPPHIPDRVVVSLGRVALPSGRQGFFPYRIEYLRTDKKDTTTKPGQTKGAIMTVYLYNVQFDPQINESLFDYRPGELDPEDKTSDYIQKLK